MQNILISPSMLSCDFGHMEQDIKMINNSEASWFHIDVMDGVFVPNISFGFPIMKHIKKYANKPLDVHLMIVHPEQYFEEFKRNGADILTIHYEASPHLHRSISRIKELGMKAGVALNPHTPISLLSDIITDVDMVLLMSVNPGFGGQSFIENTYQKLIELRQLMKTKNAQCLVQVDGGVNTNNAHKLAEAGANVLVAGNAVFASDNPAQTIIDLK